MDRMTKKWMRAVSKKFEKAKGSKDFLIVQADSDSLETFYVLLRPTGGHYAGQMHILEFKTKYGSPTKYFPFKCPLVKFLTKIYHPNVSSAGTICVDIFTNPKQWSPSYDFNAVMTSIILLMDTPNNASPYNGEAARLFRKCEKTFNDATKGKKFAGDEMNKIYDKIFEPYDVAAKNHAQNKTILDTHMKFFDEELLKEAEEKTKELSLATEVQGTPIIEEKKE